MKYSIFILFFFYYYSTFAQETKQPEDFGFYQLPFSFEGQAVNLLICAKSREDQIRKPLLLFVQGSLPQPLLKCDSNGNNYGTFPFNPLPYLDKYHLAIIGKPGVPLMVNVEKLEQPHFTYKDPDTNTFLRDYCKNNHLDFYVNRNIAVLDFLAKEQWVDEDNIIVAGHSEGVSIAFKMA